jgi:hypothetical protein
MFFYILKKTNAIKRGEITDENWLKSCFLRLRIRSFPYKHAGTPDIGPLFCSIFSYLAYNISSRVLENKHGPSYGNHRCYWAAKTEKEAHQES